MLTTVSNAFDFLDSFRVFPSAFNAAFPHFTENTSKEFNTDLIIALSVFFTVTYMLSSSVISMSIMFSFAKIFDCPRKRITPFSIK